MEIIQKNCVGGDNITNLMPGKDILTDLYDIFMVPSGEKLFIFPEKMIPDLILPNIKMPGNGYEVIKRLKADEKTRTNPGPVIFRGELNYESKNQTNGNYYRHDDGGGFGHLNYLVDPGQRPTG
jgi:CheY-like chemotaxis protein